MRIVDCLDVCSQSNVVVIKDRREGAPKSLWLGGITTDSLTDALCGWIAAGAWRADLPAALSAKMFPAPNSRPDDMLDLDDLNDWTVQRVGVRVALRR